MTLRVGRFHSHEPGVPPAASHADAAAAAVLRALGPEPDRAARQVHVGPAQGQDLALAPAGQVSEPDQVPEPESSREE